MRARQVIGGGAGGTTISAPQSAYAGNRVVGGGGMVMNGGGVRVSPSSLPIVDQKNRIVEPVSPRIGGVAAGFDLNRAYDAVKTLIDMCPNTPEFAIYANMLNGLGDSGKFNKDDSRTLDRVMSAVVNYSLEEILDRDAVKYANLMEIISRRGASVDVSPDNVSKWVGGSSGRFGGQSLVQQAINAFRVYMMDNSLKSFDNIAKFKKHFNNFVTKKPEYKDVLVSEAWSVYQGGVR